MRRTSLAVVRSGVVAAAALLLVACTELANLPLFDTPTPEPAIEQATPEPAIEQPTIAPTDQPIVAVPTETAARQSLPPSRYQRQVDRLRSDYGAVGAMAVVQESGAQTFTASGTADVAGTPISPSTRFRIASITKPLTAALVLRDVADGQLSLDQTVGELVTGLLRPDPPVTVRQLLSHTSGIFDEINQPNMFADIPNLADEGLRSEATDIEARYEGDERTIMPDRLIVALSETHNRYFSPGTDFHYSNTNYQLAAMALEATTDQSLAALLGQEVIEPLGLSHTTLLPPDTASPEFRGYVISRSDGSLIDVTDDLLIYGNGGPGGIITTPNELLTMVQAVVGGQIAPADQVRLMEQPVTGSYGLGLGTYDFACGTYYGHEGGSNGTQSVAVVSADGSSGAVIAINLAGPSDRGLVTLAEELVCGS